MEKADHPMDTSNWQTPLSNLVDRYDGLLCDIWGVLHNGVAAFDCAVDALRKARARGLFVILVTNAPRLSKDIHPQLARFGVPRDAFDTLITSGDVIKTLIAGQPNSALFHFGATRDHSVLDGLPDPIVGMQDARLCLLTGPYDDTIDTAEIYHADLVKMRDNAVMMICANPDLVVRSGPRMVICAGSIAKLYSQLGGKVIFAGKPEREIYTEALSRAKAIAGRDIPKNRLLAVGDGLLTDIKGAADNGFDAYFIAGGIHAIEYDELRTEDDAKRAVNTIKSQYSKLNLAGVCNRLRWI
tara:strand:- start:887 stop:1783 length:897 start_codon:yes stop_codon:yes gene_type:complete